MVRVLLSQAAAEQLKDQWPVLEKESGTQIELVEVRNERLDERADVAYFAAVDYRNEIYIDSMMSSAANGSLKWAHIAWVGADRQIFSDLAEHGVEITNSAGYNAVAIANTVIGAILSLARGFHHWRDAQATKVWRGGPEWALRQRDIRGQKAVIFGLGSIGNEVARLCRAFGIHTVGVRRSVKREGDHSDTVVSPEQLQYEVSDTDWLVLAAPLSPSTHNAISAEVLSCLPSTAYVINVGRGRVIDEQALVEALQSERLAGAYLDVFSTEPLPEDSPLWNMTNVLVSPHQSFVAEGNFKRASEMWCMNLVRWCQQEPLVNLLNAADMRPVGKARL